VSLCHCLLHLVVELRGRLHLLVHLAKGGEGLAQILSQPLLVLPERLDVLLSLDLLQDDVEHLLLELLSQEESLDLCPRIVAAAFLHLVV